MRSKHISRTSMTLGWLSSRRYLTSRMADMSRPSLNCPTLIFFMATRRPVVFSRADATTDNVQVEDEEAVARETDPCTRQRMNLHLGESVLITVARNCTAASKSIPILASFNLFANQPMCDREATYTRLLTTSPVSQRWLSQQRP